MAHVVTDLVELYKTYFQQPYCVTLENIPTSDFVTVFSQPLRQETVQGVEVFLPVRLRAEGHEIDIACATIRATSRKMVVRTAVAERRGTVKELFQVGDWEFTIKGVLIAKNGVFPDREMLTLRRIYESPKQAELENALSDLFLDESKNVCVTSLEFPEVEGRDNRHRPFTLVCESDFITDLRL